jgi:hypothetical protein
MSLDTFGRMLGTSAAASLQAGSRRGAEHGSRHQRYARPTGAILVSTEAVAGTTSAVAGTTLTMGAAAEIGEFEPRYLEDPWLAAETRAVAAFEERHG